MTATRTVTIHFVPEPAVSGSHPAWIQYELHDDEDPVEVARDRSRRYVAVGWTVERVELKTVTTEIADLDLEGIR